MVCMMPALPPCSMNPDDYHHPINHAWAYSQGYSVEQLLAETGRTYTPTSIYLKSDDADIAREIQDVSSSKWEGAHLAIVGMHACQVVPCTTRMVVYSYRMKDMLIVALPMSMMGPRTHGRLLLVAYYLFEPSCCNNNHCPWPSRLVRVRVP